MPVRLLPEDDLRAVAEVAAPAFESLRGARILVTGGTGFFGHWLLESVIFANRQRNLDIKITLLTRDASGFATLSPHIALDPIVTLHEGNIETFAFPTQPHSHILHAAADSGARYPTQPDELNRSIAVGTDRVLCFASATAAKRMLFVSTGAVYGRFTPLLNTPESYLDNRLPILAPDSYEGAKRYAESLCLTAYHEAGLAVVLARCFAFLGPHLPLDGHFAIGNFLSAATSGRPIALTGDGSPRRAWMYMSDLAAWLWTMLALGQPGRAYNVGSPYGCTIAEAARTTASTLNPALPISINGTPVPTAPLQSYVPSIDRATTELGLRITVPLEEAIRRTAAWHGFVLSHAATR